MQALKVVLRNHTGLAYKLGLSIVLSTAVIFSALGYLNLRAHQRHSEELVLQSADRITDIIRRSTRYQMLHNDREALYQTIRDMGSEPGIRRIRIFNKEGRISFSTDPKEAGSTVDKQAEACYGCHGKGTPMVRLDRPDRARIFKEASGERVLGVIGRLRTRRPARMPSATRTRPSAGSWG
jgi:hypothetical protein